MTGVLCALLAPKGPPPLDTQVVFAQLYDDGTYVYTGFIKNVIGTITDGTSDLYSGAEISGLYIDYTFPTASLNFTVVGNRANSGWTSMYLGGVQYDRTAATYAYNGVDTNWRWLAPASSFTLDSNNTVTWS